MSKNTTIPTTIPSLRFFLHNASWIVLLLSFAAQCVVLVLFSQRLVRELGVWSLILPLFVFVLFAGVLFRQRHLLLVAFIWSIVLVIHGFTLVFIQFHPLQFVYIVFGLVQSWCLTNYTGGTILSKLSEHASDTGPY